MLDRFDWGRKLARATRLFFFKHDVLRSAQLAGKPETIMRLYDFFAPVYDYLFPRFQTYQATGDHVLEHRVLPDDVVLDLGAGTGFLSLKLAGKARRVVAMDLHHKSLVKAREKARERGVTGSLVYNQGTATELPFTQGAFNLVTSGFMEVYLTIPEKRAMLDEIRRVLAPGGRVVFMTGNGDISGRYIPRSTWDEILSDAGFADVEVTTLFDVYRVICARKSPCLPESVSADGPDL